MHSKSKFMQISTSAEVILHIVFLLITFLCLVPLWAVVAISLSDDEAMRQVGYRLIPVKFSAKSYDFVLGQGIAIARAYGITIFVTAVGTLLCVAVVSMYAYVLFRKDFKYRKFFTFFGFFTMLINAGLVPWYIVCVNVLHLKNTIFALIFPYVMNMWYVLIFRTYLSMSLPDSIIESAKIDGAGEFTIFFKIVIPLVKPGLATIALFAAIMYWNDWWLPFMLIEKEELYNLQYLMYRVQQKIQYLAEIASKLAMNPSIPPDIPAESSRMAMAVLGMGPIVLAYPFFQRYFVKGLTIGAIKG
ncbi:binding-protein-dependent transport systems inner membrane component [Caldicellulosiruptor saccharolyticus DSM 8903]|uniref:Binding-protein-dependent transport systems inner membrane component n=1 Tax=Caldicellulosiruptor saccharolyticus (strain ATCC 43494 / DSM 8903 / Tp8T 6331) TaxID=351627 RepID=A4XHB4_CALS8|nr:carbohydrate ABC transporter permease [Caldicellulosiruptor saccharolyticus]ABP66299.1 binding-protein-dependent transport systems inner membrane component [Caldicellulosiruptor saccharolyticus DSM 8903]